MFQRIAYKVRNFIEDLFEHAKHLNNSFVNYVWSPVHNMLFSHVNINLSCDLVVLLTQCFFEDKFPSSGGKIFVLSWGCIGEIQNSQYSIQIIE